MFFHASHEIPRVLRYHCAVGFVGNDETGNAGATYANDGEIYGNPYG
jgi:hypothetical protein